MNLATKCYRRLTAEVTGIGDESGGAVPEMPSLLTARARAKAFDSVPYNLLVITLCLDAIFQGQIHIPLEVLATRGHFADLHFT